MQLPFPTVLYMGYDFHNYFCQKIVALSCVVCKCLCKVGKIEPTQLCTAGSNDHCQSQTFAEVVKVASRVRQYMWRCLVILYIRGSTWYIEPFLLYQAFQNMAEI